MKLSVSLPGKGAIALTVVGFALGGVSAMVAAGQPFPFIESLSGKHEVTSSEPRKDAKKSHSSERGEKQAKSKKSSHGNADDHGNETEHATTDSDDGNGHTKKVANSEETDEVKAADKTDHAPNDRGETAGQTKQVREPKETTPDMAGGKTTEHEAKNLAQPANSTPAIEAYRAAEEKSAGTMEATSSKASEHSVPGADSHWGYDGPASPENWAALSAEYKSCGDGIEQTPIDLTSGIKGEVSPIYFNYKTQPLKISNNGHTIQVSTAPGSFLTISGKKYELVQFHFHHPSEHLLDGRAFAMELHLVHKAADGAIAVVGVFFKIGMANVQIEQIFSQMPQSKGAEVVVKGLSNAGAFLPKSRSFYRYMGSLTTPPCTEGLMWTVFKEPLEVSQEQLNAFTALFPHNARPVQQRNRRFLLEASAK